MTSQLPKEFRETSHHGVQQFDTITIKDSTKSTNLHMSQYLALKRHLMLMHTQKLN